MMRRRSGLSGLVFSLLAAAVGIWMAVFIASLPPRRTPPSLPAPPAPIEAPPRQTIEQPIPAQPPALSPAPPAESAPSCQDAPLFDVAARANAATLSTLRWAPFRREEIGWEIYAPLIGREIGSKCPAVSTNFAQALAAWQRGRGVAANGVLRAEDFMTMKAAWQGQRRVTHMRGFCPPPPPEQDLPWSRPEEGYARKPVRMRMGVLLAYRQMVAVARAEEPAIVNDPQLLTIFSAYRSPDYDAARCARDQNCNGVVRAECSPHRTGLALDLDVGAAPGFTVDSSADANRLFQTRGAAYRWLVGNAGRFGFANYPFEPWHWEWTGEAP